MGNDYWKCPSVGWSVSWLVSVLVSIGQEVTLPRSYLGTRLMNELIIIISSLSYAWQSQFIELKFRRNCFIMFATQTDIVCHHWQPLNEFTFHWPFKKVRHSFFAVLVVNENLMSLDNYKGQKTYIQVVRSQVFSREFGGGIRLYKYHYFILYKLKLRGNGSTPPFHLCIVCL